MAGMLCVALLLTSLIWSAAPTAGSAGDGRRQQQLTALPPRGWNSYDSFSWIIDEAAFLDNARIMANRLLPHGYQVGDDPIRGFITDSWIILAAFLLCCCDMTWMLHARSTR